MSDVGHWLFSDDEFDDDDEAFLDLDEESRDDPPEDDDGLGGVREPSRPLNDPSAGAVELPEPGTEGFSAH